MNIETLFYQLPLWSIYIITVVVVLISVVGGFLLGKMIRRRGRSEQEAPIGAVVGALLGLLAFLLAFTFGMTASRLRQGNNYC